MKTSLGLLFGALAVAGLACSDDSEPPKQDSGSVTCGVAAFLPPDGKVKDYKQESAAKVAVNAKELQDIVDGGSEKYEEEKFRCMAEVVYASATSGAKIKVWIFDQTDSAGAKGAYDRVGTGSETAITPTLGDASQEDLTLPTTYLANLRKGQYLVRVFVDKKDGKEDGLLLLKEVVGAIR